MKNLTCLLIVSLFFALSLNAQPNTQNAKFQRHFDRGVELFDAHRYTDAQYEFERMSDLTHTDDPALRLKTDYYIALCATRNGADNAEGLLNTFSDNYPNSIYVTDIAFNLGLILHQKGEYETAYMKFLEVSPFDVDPKLRNEYYFKIGQSAFKNGMNDKAYQYLTQVGNSEYSVHATYLKSYIEYSEENLSAAKKGFLQLVDTKEYSPIAPFYLLQIEFKEGNYSYVIENGTRLMNKATDARRMEIARIVSEAYFHQQDYFNALEYISQYQKLGGKMNPEEAYIAGFCNYYLKNYPVAISWFSQIAEEQSELGQNSAYHLAECYLKTGDKQRAQRMFAAAAAMNYNPHIQQDALLNQGKLLYELGGGIFSESITILKRYLDLYPNSPQAVEARECLLAAYFNSRDYESAYQAILKLPNPDNSVKTAMQKITYFRALQYFEAGNYPKAIEMLNISIANQFNPKYTALSRYWKAEALMRNEQYREAIPLFSEYISLSPRTERENKVAHYNLGYCYFNTQQWASAKNWFDKFTATYSTKDDLRADAYNRKGDALFAMREYQNALAQYDNSIKIASTNRDYAQYQRAIMLGLLNRTDSKIESLLSIIASQKGEYVDDAMYELGRTYIQKERFTDGATILKKLVAQFPNSPYYLSAVSDLGLTYQNMGNDDEALRFYKVVVSQFPSSPQAKDALIGIRNIYVDKNDVNSYFNFAKEAGIETNATVVERDSMTFAASERLYMSGNYKKTIPSMQNYIAQFPRGAYRSNALYYIADSKQRTGDQEGALEAFEEVSDNFNNEFKPLALKSAAQIAYNLKEFEKAAKHYKQLSEISTQATAVKEALERYLQAAIESGNTQLAKTAAGDVSVSPFATKELIAHANFAKAHALRSEGDNDGALELYLKVSDEPSREGAESRFRVITILHSQGKLDEAEKRVLEFAEKGTSYQYWLGKSFLILGDIYVAKNDAFQAKATYQSIIDGYSDKNDGVVAEAQAKLSKLK